MRQQRGFVTLHFVPELGARRHADGVHVGFPRLGPWRDALRRVRFFVSGVLIGTGIWTPVFAAMADDPEPWGAAAALALLGVAAVVGRRG